MKYSERYEKVIASGEYHGRKEKIIALAKIHYSEDRTQKKSDCIWQALEDYEDMTGNFYDPTHEEFEDIEISIL
jgi:hypothetical protein